MRVHSVCSCLVSVQIDAEDCILDGEVVVWDSDNEAFVRFGSARVSECLCYHPRGLVAQHGNTTVLFSPQTVVAEQMEDPGSKRHLVHTHT